MSPMLPPDLKPPLARAHCAPFILYIGGSRSGICQMCTTFFFLRYLASCKILMKLKETEFVWNSNIFGGADRAP